MKIAHAIINNSLSIEGGVYRTMPLFSLSCIGQGYGRSIRHVTDMTYGNIGGIGSAKGMQTLYRIDAVIEGVAKRIRNGRSWIPRITRAGSRLCYQFKGELECRATTITKDPAAFFRFAIRQYPMYLAGIGAYNLLWRYVEFAPVGAVCLSQRTLRQLAAERNELAKIYPRCETLLKMAARALAGKLGVKSALVLMMTRAELANTLRTKRLAVPEKILVQRCSSYAYYTDVRKEWVSTSQSELRAITKHLHSNWAVYTHTRVAGKTITPGKVKGTVVTGWRRSSWPRRPVYVTAMTHPQEIPYLKKVSAIVTDEGGGILSHAAIVSRELGIPCVIGTKVATRIFKNGDRVEVDATRGIVKKIVNKRTRIIAN